MLRLAAPALAVMLALAGASAAAAASGDEAVARHSRTLIVGPDADFRNALAALRTRGKPDAAAAWCAGHAIVAGRDTLWAATSNTAAISLRASL